MRVLVVKLGAMGDVIMSLTMITALRASEPTAHLTWVVGGASRPILELVDGVDEIICVDERHMLRGGLVERVRALSGLWSRIAGRSFDLVVTGHVDRRYRILSAPVFARARRAFAPIPGRYHGHEYARLISNCDGPSIQNYRLPEIAQRLPPPPFERRAGRPVIVLAPGGARNVLRDDPLRRWPVEHYAALARALVDDGSTVVVIGAPHERHIAEMFAEVAVIDLIGRTSFPELAATIRTADVIVTHDSLALHVAHLTRTPTVALFGPTVPTEKVPSATSVGHLSPIRVIWGGGQLPCRPCYDGKNYFACQSNACMRELSIEEVLASLRELLRDRPKLQSSRQVTDR